METLEISMQAFLCGSNLNLRPLRASDWEELYSCASDPEVWKLHPEKNRFERDRFLAYFHKALDSGSAFTVIDKSTGKAIGSSRYYDLNLSEKRVCVGYTFLSKNHWGGSYNRELKYLMLRHAFQYVEQVRFEIGIDNLRSRRAIEKIGARLEKVSPSNETPYSLTLDGTTHVIYSMNFSQFTESFAD